VVGLLRHLEADSRPAVMQMQPMTNCVCSVHILHIPGKVADLVGAVKGLFNRIAAKFGNTS